MSGYRLHKRRNEWSGYVHFILSGVLLSIVGNQALYKRNHVHSECSFDPDDGGGG